MVEKRVDHDADDADDDDETVGRESVFLLSNQQSDPEEEEQQEEGLFLEWGRPEREGEHYSMRESGREER